MYKWKLTVQTKMNEMKLYSWENAGLYFSAHHHFFKAKQLQFTFMYETCQ